VFAVTLPARVHKCTPWSSRCWRGCLFRAPAKITGRSAENRRARNAPERLSSRVQTISVLMRTQHTESDTVDCVGETSDSGVNGTTWPAHLPSRGRRTARSWIPPRRSTAIRSGAGVQCRPINTSRPRRSVPPAPGRDDPQNRSGERRKMRSNRTMAAKTRQGQPNHLRQ